MGNRREYEDCCLLGCDAASFDVEDPIFGGTRCLQIQGDDLVKRDQHFGENFFLHIQRGINFSDILAAPIFREMVPWKGTSVAKDISPFIFRKPSTFQGCSLLSSGRWCVRNV
jgi:hypothetical protein